MKKFDTKGAPVKFKQLVDLAIRDAAWELSVEHYSISFDFPAKNDRRDSSGYGRSAASTSVGRRYLRARVSIYPWFVEAWKNKEYTDQYVREVIFHEVAHVVTQHLYELAIATYRDEGEMVDAWESLTTSVGRLAHRLAKLSSAKK